MTTPDLLSAPPVSDSIHALLAELRAAGWRHTRTTAPMSGRDQDGAPWSEDEWEIHQWTRGEELIEVYADRANGTGLGWINYDPAGTSRYDDNMISVGS